MSKEWTQADVDTFIGLCEIMATRDEIKHVMKLNDKDLDRLVKHHLDEPYEDAYERYTAKGKVDLRRAQYQTALEGNTTMQIWLGKQMLGQTDPDKGKTMTKGEKKNRDKASIMTFRANSPVAKAAG